MDFCDLKDLHKNSRVRKFFNFSAQDLIFWILAHIIYALRLVKNWSQGPFWSFSGVRVLRTRPQEITMSQKPGVDRVKVDTTLNGGI